MKILNYFLTDFEQEILKEMDKPEKWTQDKYTLNHAVGFRFWTLDIAFIPFLDFNACNDAHGKIKTPKISGWIAKFLLWAKYHFVLNPALEKIEYTLAYQALKNDQESAMSALNSEDKNNA